MGGRTKVEVTSLGGGPGMDLYAVVGAQDELFNTRPESYNFKIFDKIEEWKWTFELLSLQTLPTEIECEWSQVDFTQTGVEEDAKLV